MRILFVNPSNTQGSLHSRKGMYVPLGILSVATAAKERFGDRITLTVVDEDVEVLEYSQLKDYDIICFYATTFNYLQAVRYAYMAKASGAITIIGGPHASILPENILTNRNCFDYITRFEGEAPFLELLGHLLGDEEARTPDAIPNLAYRDSDGQIRLNAEIHVNDLEMIPIPSREFIDFERYIDNYRRVYPDKEHIRPGSIYSSKGCSWRDKSGGCIFCARLEEGVRFRNIDQIWREIEMLKEQYGVNTIWDIADDNLNNKDWFIKFVESRPKSCEDVDFFIYSRVNPIKPWVMEYFHRLNVREVFLGVESGDNRLLKGAFKGQTREIAMRAIKLLNESNIKFYPSFVLGLPGENEESLNNTLSMCQEIADLGGLDRMAATILKPTPGSPAFFRLINETPAGPDLAKMDHIDLTFLERYWAQHFVETSFETVLEYKGKIDELMKEYQVFGGNVSDRS